MTAYCAGPGRHHEAAWRLRATAGHPYQTAACDKHLDQITNNMTVRGRPPTITPANDEDTRLFEYTP